jgi:hypothetical protein
MEAPTTSSNRLAPSSGRRGKAMDESNSRWNFTGRGDSASSMSDMIFPLQVPTDEAD